MHLTFAKVMAIDSFELFQFLESRKNNFFAGFLDLTSKEYFV